tara:strand:- start:45 stop:671 length:627 start_codon:yes stop_codon:yes gene_type:complete
MNIEVIDNFLNAEDLREIESINLEKIDRNKIKVYHNSINKNNKVESDCINTDIVIRLHKNYHERVFNILNKMCPEKSHLYDYSDFHIIETGADYKFPIHDDTPNKLLSGVIYIKPKKNNGTFFYDNKNGKGKKIIEWKVNRAAFFCRKERQTWHSYEGDGTSNRIALVYNLMTKRTKEVYAVEKKNYFLGNLRFKINPYLYRFFKFII